MEKSPEFKTGRHTEQQPKDRKPVDERTKRALGNAAIKGSQK